VHLESYLPNSWSVDPSEVGGEVERPVCPARVGSPVDVDGLDAREDVVAEIGNKGTSLAVEYVQGEDVLWEASVGGLVDAAGFAPDHLAGHAERPAWRCRGLVELDAAVIFDRFDGEDE
jgi:hypothetical protein